MKEITKYNIEELRRLYKSIALYKFTEMLKRQLKLQNSKSVFELDVEESPFLGDFRDLTEYETEEKSNDEIKEFMRKGRMKMKLFYDNKYLHEEKGAYTKYKYNIKKYIDLYGDYNKEKEINPESTKTHNLQNMLSYYNFCGEVIFWCGGVYEYETKEAIIMDNGRKEQLETKFVELHINDEINKESGKVTEKEIYDFIWETLRYCTLEEIDMLLGLVDYKFDPIISHRPANNKKIYKYDKEGILVATFINREDCINKENIKKQALSHVLTGKRKSLNGFIYREDKLLHE